MKKVSTAAGSGGRMRSVLAAVMVLVACLAIGSAGLATAKKKKPKKILTGISLTIEKTSPSTYSPGSSRYFGSVSARGPRRCTAGRKVTIARNGAPFATTVSQTDGSYSVTVPAVPPAGQYTARVVKRKIKKKNRKTGKKKRIICRGAATPPVTIQ